MTNQILLYIHLSLDAALNYKARQLTKNMKFATWQDIHGEVSRVLSALQVKVRRLLQTQDCRVSIGKDMHIAALGSKNEPTKTEKQGKGNNIKYCL